MRCIFLLSVLCLLGGCASQVKDAFAPSKSILEDRQMQTRTFDSGDERKILVATAGLLQDLGFNLDESETALGVLVASKQRDATDTGQVIAAAIVAGMGNGQMPPVDKIQQLRASVVTTKSSVNKVVVRVTFQRVIFNTYGQVSRLEKLAEPEMYQGFFEKLSKSVFLEAHNI